MSVFIEEAETKRVIFNVKLDLAQRLEQAKSDARNHGKKLDVDGSINKALEKFLKKAEKRLRDMDEKHGYDEKKKLKISSASSNPETDEAGNDNVTAVDNHFHSNEEVNDEEQ